jgi:polyisoprenoid-binding protein YceI
MSTTPQAAAVSTWNIDPVHSIAEFRVKHMMISSVRGQFTGVTGSLTYNEGDPAQSRVEATVDVSTINTHEPQRDAHLKSADFFDAEKYPVFTFKSSRVTRRANGSLAVAGPLAMHGVTKEVEFAVAGPTPAVKDPWGNTRIGVSATTKINRGDFGLTFNAALETGGVLVGEEVSITLELESKPDPFACGIRHNLPAHPCRIMLPGGCGHRRFRCNPVPTACARRRAGRRLPPMGLQPGAAARAGWICAQLAPRGLH